MINELAKFGKFILHEEGSLRVFKEDWKQPRIKGNKRDIILNLHVNEGNLNTKIIDPKELPEEHHFYFVGGNDSPSGSTGVKSFPHVIGS